VKHHLFAYGSLVVPIVMQTVTGRSFRHAVAHLQGFERFMLKGRVYPGVTETEGCVTPGRVYFDLDEDAMSRLDYFEADDYVRRTADVRLEDSSVVPASVYVVPDHLEDLMTDIEWNEDKFVVQDLEGFLEQTRNSMLDYRAAT
jgi:gamma-glutamylcyclotransferase (GGCT)/AIG2-like uncharacterized protein YtfP